MSTLLLWLAIPLVLLPAVELPGRLGAAAARLVMAGLGLGALAQGVGSLDPGDLREVASQSPHGAWFVGLTIGLLITGTCIASDVRSWRTTALGGPLLVGLVVAIARDAIIAVLAGCVIGLVPMALARTLPRRVMPQPALRENVRALVPRPVSLVLGIVTVVSACFGPLAVAMAALGALGWHEWALPGAPPARRRLPILPVLATLLLAAWLWLALAIGDSPFISFVRLAADSPVSEAAAVLLALLAIGWAIAIAQPWPLDRAADVTVQLPVLGVVFCLAMHATPDGMAHWQPLLSLIMVPAAVVAVAGARWDAAAAALVLLGVTRPGPVALGAAALLAVGPAARRMTDSARLASGVAGVAVAGVIATMLRDQVLLAVVLALGVAVAAMRQDSVVAAG
jgi:hypothetical protein